MINKIYDERAVATGGAAAEASLEELLAFERLLFDLSARFANVAGDQVVTEIESALKELLKFLDFDRGVFAEFTDEGKQDILCSVVARGVEPLLPGPTPAWADWLVSELRSGRTLSCDHTRISRRRQLPQPNTIAASVFASSLSFHCLLAAAPLRRSVSAHSAPRANGQTHSSRA